MIGSHRDAMTFGAIDPGSGTTVLAARCRCLPRARAARLEAEAHDRVRLVGRPRTRPLRFGRLHLPERSGAAQERLSVHQYRSADDRRSVRRQRVARALRLHEADLRRRAGRDGARCSGCAISATIRCSIRSAAARIIRTSRTCSACSARSNGYYGVVRRASHRRR